MSYTGHHMATLGSKALWVFVLALFCFPATLALFPSAHEAFWGDARGGDVILQMSHLLVILLFGGIAAPIACALVFAI